MNQLPEKDEHSAVDRRSRFLACWDEVQQRYADGFCVSERGLQAYVFRELQAKFNDHCVVVEPQWISSAGQIYIPDLVMLKKDKITDIFELKFAPHGYVHFSRDIHKLSRYLSDSTAKFLVKLNARTGRWEDSPYFVDSATAFHFIALARFDSEAVYPECLLATHAGGKVLQNRLWHWYGRTGSGNIDGRLWNIERVPTNPDG